MLGVMNVPCESATEYYASPDSKPRSMSLTAQTQSSINADGSASFRTQSQKRLYTRRRSSQINYLKDGRKLFDGKPIENISASQLWEKLLLTSIVHKIEDEISSPAPKEEPAKREMFTVSESAIEFTSSSLSLVSKDLIEHESPNASVCQQHSDSKKRSHSYDFSRQIKADEHVEKL